MSHVEGSAPEAAEDPGFGVYVHWPFCLSKCPYCDFNSHVRHSGVDEERYVRAILCELGETAQRIAGRQVTSVFFGGGTPSLMAPGSVAAILDGIARHWQLAADAEISLEANPSSVEAGRFRGYRHAGINRVSLGLQALEDAALRELGRLHSASEALAALAVAQQNFERVSCDLIYARPRQTPQAWRRELERAIRLGTEHLSLYQLTVEDNTPFAALHAAGKLVLPDPDRARELYELTQEICTAHGLAAYEVSNHARSGGQCRHNLVYWRYGEYAGIGPGAHGRLLVGGRRAATATEKHPEHWLMLVENRGHGRVCEEALSRAEQADEFLLMGLRLVEGIDPRRYARLARRPLAAQRIAFLVEHGLIERTVSGRLRVTAAGFPVLDAVVADLAA